MRAVALSGSGQDMMALMDAREGRNPYLRCSNDYTPDKGRYISKPYNRLQNSSFSLIIKKVKGVVDVVGGELVI